MALVDDGFEQSDLSDREKVVIRFTDALLAADRLTDGLDADLHDHFDDGQIVELATGIALFLGFSKIAISLGQAPADMPVMVVPTPEWSE